ncbi:type I-F CRISPR-associated protein Csy2 [uncultured Amphritea sp.]|uniref:type I-F CRISPR-associated protein Csy2 n=1 Tax=uncultured Amphritea sp. TaxID=981605 RepID=UPI0025D72BED|nr:type I-F CRISPR-associated protein Csy2 [uncultured Amphritea sp.]
MNTRVLLIPHLRVHNANALSSPFTIGFPAMTAWLGAMHALQRKINQRGRNTHFDVQFQGVGVVCHRFNLQTYRGDGDYVSSIIGTANPVDKDGSRPAFIEEGRCHLDVSLVVELPPMTQAEQNSLKVHASHCLQAGMKMAGGDILGVSPLEIVDDDVTLKRRLMPGYALLERRDLMVKAMEEGQDALDAMLDYLVVHQRCQQLDDGTVSWSGQRKATGEGKKGWIVPVATGFHGISELGQAKNQRDPETPHRFAESIVTLGEFKMAYRVESVDELFWHYRCDQENNLYLCEQEKINTNNDGF